MGSLVRRVFRTLRHQKPEFWLWLVLLCFMASMLVMWWWHLASARTLEMPELTSNSTLEDMRGVINRDTLLITSLVERMEHLDGQHAWIMTLLVSTLVLMVVELAKHFLTPPRRDD